MKRAQWCMSHCKLARVLVYKSEPGGDLDWRGQLAQQCHGLLLFIIIEIIKYGRRIFMGEFSEISAFSMGLGSGSASWHSSLSSSRGFPERFRYTVHEPCLCTNSPLRDMIAQNPFLQYWPQPIYFWEIQLNWLKIVPLKAFRNEFQGWSGGQSDGGERAGETNSAIEQKKAGRKSASAWLQGFDAEFQ